MLDGILFQARGSLYFKNYLVLFSLQNKTIQKENYKIKEYRNYLCSLC